MKKPLRIALYHRIDSRCPNDMDRAHMESWLEELRSIAGRQGHQVVDVFSDFSSGNTIERPGLSALLNLVDAKLVDGVLVKDSSRICRSMAMGAQIELRLKNSGVFLFTADTIRRFQAAEKLAVAF